MGFMGHNYCSGDPHFWINFFDHDLNAKYPIEQWLGNHPRMTVFFRAVTYSLTTETRLVAEQEKGREYHLTVVGCDGWVNGEGVTIEPERAFFPRLAGKL